MRKEVYAKLSYIIVISFFVFLIAHDPRSTDSSVSVSGNLDFFSFNSETFIEKNEELDSRERLPSTNRTFSH